MRLAWFTRSEKTNIAVKFPSFFKPVRLPALAIIFTMVGRGFLMSNPVQTTPDACRSSSPLTSGLQGNSNPRICRRTLSVISRPRFSPACLFYVPLVLCHRLIFSHASTASSLALYIPRMSSLRPSCEMAAVDRVRRRGSSPSTSRNLSDVRLPVMRELVPLLTFER